MRSSTQQYRLADAGRSNPRDETGGSKRRHYSPLRL